MIGTRKIHWSNEYMQIKDDKVRLSPTDLSHFLSCRHLTSLDIRSEHGELERPEPFSPCRQ